MARSKRKSARKSSRRKMNVGQASRACAGLGKRKRKACMSRKMGSKKR